MALVALRRTQPGGRLGGVTCSSRPERANSLPTNLRDPGDALAISAADSVVSNAMSADTGFHVNYRKVEQPRGAGSLLWLAGGLGRHADRQGTWLDLGEEDS
jgi:hypothetical protein